MDVVNRLHCLLHDPIISGDNQDSDIGGLGSTRAHSGERFVSRCIDERDHLSTKISLISGNPLCDSSNFLCGYV